MRAQGLSGSGILLFPLTHSSFTGVYLFPLTVHPPRFFAMPPQVGPSGIVVGALHVQVENTIPLPPLRGKDGMGGE